MLSVLHHSRDGVQPDDSCDRRRQATLGRSGGMKFFVDTADIAEIEDLAATGLLDGVTTNPSLIAKSGGDFFEVIRQHLRHRAGAGERGGHRHRRRDHALRRPQARRARAQRRGQGAAHLGRPQGLPRAQPGRHQGQRHALLLALSGAARGEGRRGLHLALRRPARRHQPGRHGPDPRDRDDLPRLSRHHRHRDPGRLDPPSAPRGGGGEARRSTWRRCRRLVLRKLASHPLTDKGLDAFLADWQKTGQSILS